MVAHLVRLKLTLLRNIFRRSRAQAIGAILGILYFGFLVVAACVGVAALRMTPAPARLYLPLGGALMVLGWGLLPLLAFGSDPTLDPRRFATFAVPERQLALGLVLAGLVGLPGIATTVVVAGTLVTWSVSVLAALVALVSAAAGLLTCVTLSRWVSARASRAMTSRRGRDITGIVGLLLLIGLGPLFALAGGATERIADLLPTVALVAGWTPFGWIWAAPGDIVLGHVGTGLLRLVLGGAVLTVLGWLWLRAVRRQVEEPTAPEASGQAERHPGLGAFGRFPDTEVGAVAARVATYWRRDPRYQIGLVMTPVLPLLLLVPRLALDLPWTVLLMGPLVAYLLGWGEHNQVAYESTAFWVHVAAATRGRADRLGRLVPSLLLAAVLVPVYSVLGVWLSGRLDLLPAVLGVSVALLGAGCGVSSVMSVLLPYPVAEPGDSPFTTPPGGAGLQLAAQTVSTLGIAVLTAPSLVLAWLTWLGHDWARWPTALSGILLGPAVLALGVRVGGRIYDRRAPEILSGLVRT